MLFFLRIKSSSSSSGIEGLKIYLNIEELRVFGFYATPSCSF